MLSDTVFLDEEANKLPPSRGDGDHKIILLDTIPTCYSSFDLSSIYAVKYHLTTHICLYQLSFPISMIPSPLYHFPALLDLPIILIHSSYHLMHTNYLTATVPSYSDHYSHALHQPYCTSHFNSFRVIPSGISLTREAVLYCGL